MRKSSIYIVSELKPSLLKLPDLVTAIQNKKFTSVTDLFDWLMRLENKLKQLNYTECAEIAGLRAQLAEQKFVLNGKPNERKKRQLQKALEIIYPAQETVSKILQPLEDKIEQAGELIRQMLSVAYSLGIVPEATPQNFTSHIHHVWSVLANHDQLKNGVNNVKLLVGMTDGIQLLAEEIEL